MKKISNILICIIAFFAVSSCDFFNDKKKNQGTKDCVTVVEGISQEIKNKIAAQDTLMNALVLKVDALAQALTRSQEENIELKAQVEKLKNPKSTWSYITFASLAMAIIALILSLLKKGVSREDVDEIFRHNIDKSKRIAEIRVAVNQLESWLNNNRFPQSVNTNSQNLDSRLRNVESKLFYLSNKQNEVYDRTVSTTSHLQDQSHQPEELKFQKVGYAKVDTEMYFTTIYDSNQEGCVFKILFTSQTHGRFNIITLDKIQSRNDWQKKVECSGVSIKDASEFSVEEEGECEKIDENTWEVVKPLKIKLLK